MPPICGNKVNICGRSIFIRNCAAQQNKANESPLKQGETNAPLQNIRKKLRKNQVLEKKKEEQYDRETNHQRSLVISSCHSRSYPPGQVMRYQTALWLSQVKAKMEPLNKKAAIALRKLNTATNR